MPIQPLDALRAIAEVRGEAVTVPTMTTVAPWHQFSPSGLNVTCVGFMGGASSIGLGIALAQPGRRVIVLDGDGSLLMQLGSLATIAGAAPANLFHFVFRNGVYQVSGSQPIPAAATINFAEMARGAGYPHTYSFDNLEDFRVRLGDILAAGGPALIELVTEEVPDRADAGAIAAVASFPDQVEAARAALAGSVASSR